MSMNFVTFNQDYSHLAVATSRGFRIYTTEPFSLVSESKTGDVAIVEMLFSTSLVALILSPRRLQITNTKKQSTICELTFPTTVLGVRLNRRRLVVVLEDQIYLYDISNVKLLHTIDTSPNPHAICALSSSSENCYLAYPLPQKTISATLPAHAPPGSSHVAPTVGEVLIFDALKLEAVNVVSAHKTPLSNVAINNSGTLLATASDKGTIIRVFSLPKADKLYQFRRGTMPSRIYSMSFNTTSSLLCVSSATETVHIFKIGGPIRRPSVDRTASGLTQAVENIRAEAKDEAPDSGEPTSDGASEGPESIATSQRKHDGTWLGMIRRTSQNVGTTLASSVGNYLPQAVTEMWEPMRDFAWCKIPKSPPPSSSGSGQAPLGGHSGGQPPLRSVVAMSSNSPQVMVVTSEGQFFRFGIDLEKGGEGTLLKVHEVGADSERLGASVADE